MKSPNQTFLQKVFANIWFVWFLMTTLGAVVILLGAKPLSFNKVLSGGVFGFAVGAAYAVEMMLKTSILLNRIVCALIGAVAGGVICLLLSIATQGVLIGVLSGLILGFTSRNWISYVNFV